jgi:hypothetical protein
MKLQTIPLWATKKILRSFSNSLMVFIFVFFILSYQHKTCVAFDFLLCRILTHAEPIFKYKERAQNLDQFIYMDDSILQEVRQYIKTFYFSFHFLQSPHTHTNT